MSKIENTQSFADRLHTLRKRNNLSRAALAKKVGLSDKSIQNYESGDRYPNSIDIVQRLAEALGTTSHYLLGEEGHYIMEAAEIGTVKDVRQVQSLVENVTALLAGGELPDEDKDEMMRAFTEAYFKSKELNKKFTPKKFEK